MRSYGRKIQFNVFTLVRSKQINKQKSKPKQINEVAEEYAKKWLPYDEFPMLIPCVELFKKHRFADDL